MKTKLFVAIGILLGATLAYGGSDGSAFTYQGQGVVDGSDKPANGSYDLQFALYDAVTGGDLVAGFETNCAVAVTNGTFTTTLDFGYVFNGTPYWMDLADRPAGTSDAFVEALPRQPVLPVALALYSDYAGTASNALSISSTNITGILPDATLSGNVALLNGNNLFTGASGFAGTVALTNSGNLFSGVFVATSLSGNGAGLTNLAGNSLAALNQLTVYSNLVVSNVTPATSSAPQNSPALSLYGNSWSGASGSVPVGFAEQNVVQNSGSLTPSKGSLNVYYTTNGGASSKLASFTTMRSMHDAYQDSVTPPTAGVMGVTGPGPGDQIALSFYTYGADLFFSSTNHILEIDGVAPNGRVNAVADFLTANSGNIFQVRNSNDTMSMFMSYESGQTPIIGTENDASTNAIDLAITPSGRLLLGNGVIISNGNFYASGVVSGNGSGLTNLNISQVSATASNFTATATNFANYLVVSNAPVFNAAGLTNLSGAQFSGPIPQSALPANVVTNVGGAKILLNAVQFAYMPNQSLYSNSMIIGNGGLKLSTTGVNPVDPLTFESDGVYNGTLNTFVGIGVGWANTTGNQNTFVGSLAGSNNINGDQDTFVGVYAGAANTSGYHNTFVGECAGFVNTTGYFNTFVGTDAGLGARAGSANTFFGTSCGLVNAGSFNSFTGVNCAANNTTGTYNTFYGYDAGNANTVGSDNAFYGVKSGQANITGSNNVAFGEYSLELNTNGQSNVSIGPSSLQDNLSGNYNVAVGIEALRTQTGSENSANGYKGLFNLTTGNNNASAGFQAGYTLFSGGNNTFLGAAADVTPNASTNLNYATAIGSGAIATASHTVTLGTPAENVMVPGNVRVAGTAIATNGFGSFGTNVLLASPASSWNGNVPTLNSGWTNNLGVNMEANISANSGNLVFYQCGGLNGATVAAHAVFTNALSANGWNKTIKPGCGFQIASGSSVIVAITP